MIRELDDVFVSEEVRHLAVIQKRVDILKDIVAFNLEVAEEEDDLFLLDPRDHYQLRDVLDPILLVVVLGEFNLHNLSPPHITGQLDQTLSARAAEADKQAVAEVQLENAQDSQKVIDCKIKEDEVHWFLRDEIVILEEAFALFNDILEKPNNEEEKKKDINIE